MYICFARRIKLKPLSCYGSQFPIQWPLPIDGIRFALLSVVENILSFTLFLFLFKNSSLQKKVGY